MQRPKNVLILFVDSLCFKSVAGKSKTALTPTFDYLRSVGMFFERHHSVTSFTTPSVGSMLTGLYPSRHGLHFQGDTQLAPGVSTLGQVFQQAGYRTLATVTEVLRDHQDLFRGFEQVTRREQEQGIHTGWGADVATQLRELATSEQPWLYLVHSFELHPQRQCDPEFRSTRWGKNYYEQTVSAVDAHLKQILDAVNLDETIVAFIADHGENSLWEPSGNEVLAHKAHRLRINRRLDGLREWFYRQGLQSKGKFLIRHNPLFHHDCHLHNYLTHVPLVLVAQDQLPAGETCQKLTSHPDLLPTLVDLTGITTPWLSYDGCSLRGLLDEKQVERPIYQELYTRFVYQSRTEAEISQQPLLLGLVTPKWHFVYCPVRPEIAPELYDLEQDFQENHNFAQVYPELVQQFRALLEAREITPVLASPAPVK